MLRFAMLITLTCGSLWIGPATAEPVFVPGSRVGLVPPPGFVPSDTFTGFIDVGVSGSILIVEMPAEAYDEVSGLSDAAWASKEITGLSRMAVRIDGVPAVLLKGRQVNSGITFEKWIAIIDFDDFTALVTAQIPAPVPGELQAAIDDSLTTIESLAALTVGEQVAALPFTIQSTDTMRVLRVLAGNTIILTRGPKDIVEVAEQPLLVITRSFARESTVALTAETVSRHAITSIASVEHVTIEHSGTVRFAGGDGFEIVARARATKTKEPVAIVQWVRMLGDDYLRIVGISGAANFPADFTVFRTIRDSVQAK